MGTYGWEIAQSEDAQQGGFSTSSISNDNELSIDSVSISLLISVPLLCV